MLTVIPITGKTDYGNVPSTHHGGQTRHGTSPSFGGLWMGGALAPAGIGLMSRKRFAKRSRVTRHGGFVLWRIR